MDTRHTHRMIIIQELYSILVNQHPPHSTKTARILSYAKELDVHIQTAAQKYAIKDIAKVDLSILRLASYELLIEKKEPPKAIINEAIDLAKELAGEKSPAFINAVLGKIYEKITA
ncbi:MAG TPA: transcription antitermination factor NusB [Patescibacteria group bacterium]|nr:transcription antitermination factor NusB [Patescibacteria group bacterium]